MKRVLLSVAAASIAMTAPAIAGSGAKHSNAASNHATAEKAPAVPASIRLNDVTFDLSKNDRSSITPVQPEPASVFATQQEVKIENYSFNLK